MGVRFVEFPPPDEENFIAVGVEFVAEDFAYKDLLRVGSFIVVVLCLGVIVLLGLRVLLCKM